MPKIYELNPNTDLAQNGWFGVIQKGAGDAMENIPLEHLKRIRVYDVDTSVGPQTVNLDAISAWSYEGVLIRDVSGNASTNNITINAGGLDLINGGSSYIISKNYGTVSIVESGPAQMIVSSETSGDVLYNVHEIDNADSPYTLTDDVDQLLVDLTAGAVTVVIGDTSEQRQVDIMVWDGDPSVNNLTIDSGAGELVQNADPLVINDANYQYANFTFRSFPTKTEWRII